MDWWLGVNQCWPMGNNCAVDWDAWSFGTSFVALLIAWLSIMVTATSAVAVFWLGHQANAVAASTHDVANEDRLREGRFLLIYLHPELLEVHSSVVAWLGNAEFLETHFLTLEHADRKKLLDPILSLKFPNAEERLSRLHVLEPGIGHCFARALGSVRFLKMAIGPTMRMKNDGNGRMQIRSLIESVGELDHDVGVVIKAAQKEMYPRS